MNISEIQQLFNLLTFIIGAMFGGAFGLVMADIDQNLPFIKHRSIFTHGILWPLILFNEPIDTPYVRWVVVGFFSAYAVHLVYDMYPRKWVGIAKIHVLGKWRLNGLLSWLWLGAGALASLMLVSHLLSSIEQSSIIIMVLVAFLFFRQQKSEEKILLPALTLGGLVTISMLF